MCGIAGFHSFEINNQEKCSLILKKMSDSISHRGPDGEGSWVNKYGVSMTHKRLAIQDLSPNGKQPMHSKSGRFTISFNGEIYNHLDLRKIFFGDTFKWRGTSDTETLIELIERIGLNKTLNNVIGMFAFAIYDSEKSKLFLVRDRFGEKPIYFFNTPKSFIFGSELKSILRFPNQKFKIDTLSLRYFFQYGYIPAPASIFKGIRKLNSGAYLECDFLNNTHNIKKVNYWKPNDIHDNNINSRYSNYQTALTKLESTLLESVKSQLISDVPIGSLLSGGIDSSLVTSLMTQCQDNVNTFSIGFKDSDFDESHYSKKVARHLRTNHTEVFLDENHCKDIVPSLPNIYCEPFADSSQIPTYLISKVASESVKVVLTGDGADELFGGYNRYTQSPRVWKIIKILPKPIRTIFASIIINIPISYKNNLEFFLGKIPQLGSKLQKIGLKMRDPNNLWEFCLAMMETFEEPSSILNTEFFDNNLHEPLIDDNLSDHNVSIENMIERIMILDINNYLPNDILCKVDRASMAVSLETRAPFLDHRVFNESTLLPLDFKIQSSSGKKILRDILSKYIPAETYERPKSGFAVPIGDWIRGDLNNWAIELISDNSLGEHSLLNNDLVRKIFEQHNSKKFDHSEKLWAILMFQSWYREYKDSIST